MNICDKTQSDSLLESAGRGDEQAREAFFNKNVGLIHSVVKHFSYTGYEGEDLFQIGSIGLIKAIDRFDPSMGTAFSTYAVPMITGEIRRFLRDDSLIKISRSTKELGIKISAIVREYEARHTSSPPISYLAERLGVPTEKIVEAMEAACPAKSLYDDTDDNKAALIDTLGDKKNDEAALIEKIALKEAIRSLPPKLLNLINLRYFQDKTQSQIAAALGISQVQVSRLEKKAILLMREKMG